MDFAKATLVDGQEAMVVVFDICSSSILVEDLTLKGALQRYIWLVGKMKNFLAKLQMRQSPPRFFFYKFTGDGWILLFPTERDRKGRVIGGGYVLEVMRELSVWFDRTFRKWADENLDTHPPTSGLTFGLDWGPLRRATIFQQQEYLARAMIVACRLQSELSGEDSPNYKALMMKSVFNEHFSPAEGYAVEDAPKKLKNIGQGRQHACKRISLLPINR